MGMDRRDFLGGGILALLPVFANKPLPVQADQVDLSKPVVIESPQLIKPGQQGAHIELGCLSDIRCNDKTFKQILITNIEGREEHDPIDFMDMRGQHFELTGERNWHFSIQGIASPSFVCVEEPGKSTEIAVYRKAR